MIVLMIKILTKLSDQATLKLKLYSCVKISFLQETLVAQKVKVFSTRIHM